MATSYPFYPTVTTNMVLSLDVVNTRTMPNTGGSTLFDITSNSNNFTLYSGTNSRVISGAIPYLSHNGTDQYGIMSYNSNFNLSSTNFTLEGYFNSLSFASGQNLISSDTYGLNFDWGIVIQDANTILIWSNGSATNVTATVPTMSVNTWYHVVITGLFNQGNTTIKIYLNGISYPVTGNIPMSISNSSQLDITLCAVGGANTRVYYLNGYLSTVRVYRYRFTDSEVLQNYKALKFRYGI